MGDLSILALNLFTFFEAVIVTPTLLLQVPYM